MKQRVFDGDKELNKPSQLYTHIVDTSKWGLHN